MNGAPVPAIGAPPVGSHSARQKEGPPVSNALDRGLDVLEILANRGEARVAELVTELDVSRATAFRIMVTLEARGFVEHVPERHVWRLGRTIGELAGALDSDEIVRIADPALSDLRAKSGETINLATIHRNKVVWAATRESGFALRMSTVIGEVVSIHSTAIGKAILAVLPEQEWARMLPAEPYPALTPNTRTTLAALRKEVELTRTRGWSLDDEECELSGVCVGAAIVGASGRPVAAISVSSVAGRLTESEREPLGRAVADWCARVSRELAPD
jgi:DNA-binding IclR family transcriptional regulator